MKNRFAELGIHDSSGYGSPSCRRGDSTADVAANVAMYLVKRYGKCRGELEEWHRLLFVRSRFKEGSFVAVSEAILAE